MRLKVVELVNYVAVCGIPQHSLNILTGSLILVLASSFASVFAALPLVDVSQKRGQLVLARSMGEKDAARADHSIHLPVYALKLGV